jgi:hypothetical protein
MRTPDMLRGGANVSKASQNPVDLPSAETALVQGPASETERSHVQFWLGRALLALSAAGWPLSMLVVRRLGRAGDLVVDVACTLLFARVAYLVLTATPARLRALPRVLVFAELVADAVAAATGFCFWVVGPLVVFEPSGRWRPVSR